MRPSRRAVTALALAAAGLIACDPDDEAAAVDAGPDAATVVGPGPISVLVLDDPLGPAPGQPRAGVPVYFVGPGGAEDVVVSDAGGRVEATVAPGTTAYVVRTREAGSGYDLTAFVDVGPGMALVAGGGIPPQFAPTLGVVEVLVEADPRADRLGLALPCGELVAGTPPGFFVALPRCADSEHATLVATASQGDVLLGYGVTADVDLTTLPATLTLAATTAPVTLRAVYTAMPFEIASVQAKVTISGDVSIRYASPLVAEGGPVQVLDVPVVPHGERTLIHTALGPRATAVAPAWNLRRFAGVRLLTHLDVGATAIPFMTSPSFDPITATLAWTYFGGAGRRPDLVSVRGFYEVPGQLVVFTIHAPGARTHVTLPFPPSLAELAPGGGSFSQVVDFHGVDVAGADYAAAVRTADGEARRGLHRADAYADHDDVWITGVDGGLFVATPE